MPSAAAPKHRITPRAKHVWTRLGEWYGSKLAEQYGPVPPEDWCEIVDRADNETVKRGLSVIRSTYVSWPPTLPQFEEAMRTTDRSRGTPSAPVTERLVEFVLKHRRLTPRQLAAPWTYLGRSFDAPGPDGKIWANWGIEFTGVVVPADGENPGYRVMVADMQIEDEA